MAHKNQTPIRTLPSQIQKLQNNKIQIGINWTQPMKQNRKTINTKIKIVARYADTNLMQKRVQVRKNENTSK